MSQKNSLFVGILKATAKKTICYSKPLLAFLSKANDIGDTFATLGHGTKAKDWPTHSSSPQNIQKNKGIYIFSHESQNNTQEKTKRK
jgi:hypothetical protein